MHLDSFQWQIVNYSGSEKILPLACPGAFEISENMLLILGGGNN